MNEETLELDEQDRVEPAMPMSPGTTIGHFRVVREIGAGGMGRVFEAHDPDLDRRVAIKVVRDPAAGDRARDRMVREAQAMARLSHPNVVTIHEVGTIGAQIFLVMEYVAGETLAKWLERPRSWREIVSVFVQAGDGLAAAHAAGLVHRDFKPNNVLVDEAGRVRVGDFGLAHLEGKSMTLAEGSGPKGTPAYIAPEQRAGGPVDGRADQYAFGVSLERALAKMHPPRRIRVAIARALAIEPVGRFAEIDELVRELRAALSRRARIGLAGVVATAVAGGAGLAFLLVPAAEHSCDAGTELVDELWNPAQRDAVAAGLKGGRASPDAIATATRLVDDWAAAWRLGREATCEAEPAQRPARVACLDRALGDVRAQLAVWRVADPKAAELVVTAAARLPDLAACATPAVRVTVHHVAAQIASLRALARSGHAAGTRDQRAGMLAAAEAAGDAATLAEALVVSAEIERELGNHAIARDQLARAARAAGSVRDHALMTHALVTAAKVTTDQGRPLDGLGMLDAADAIAATGDYDRVERIAYARGVAYAEAGRAADAIAQLERAISLLETRATRDHTARGELAAALVWLASAHAKVMRYSRALPFAERALAIEEADLGPNHPQVGETLHTIANLMTRLERYAIAGSTYDRARRIFVAAYGERHEVVGATDLQLAQLALLQNQPDAARAHYQRALQAFANLPPDHPTIAAVEGGLGSLERDLDRCAEAVPHYDRAIAIFEKVGRGGAELAIQLVNRGACLLYTNRLAESKQSLARAEALFTSASVEPHVFSELWLLQAELFDAVGKRADAIAITKHMLASTRDSDSQAVAGLRAYARDLLVKWR